MKKIGLFTYYRSNYGASLQAFALKVFIETAFEDVEVSVVDYYKTHSYPVFEISSKNTIKKIIKSCLVLLHYFEIRRRNARHTLFNENFLKHIRFVERADMILKTPPVFDIYLTGSDQVFNIHHNEYKQLFFQQFEIKSGLKAAYAPSFGQSNFTDEEKIIIKRLTESFDFLSCRETDGAAILSEVHGKNIQSVIDPTLLLTNEQWNQMMIPPNLEQAYLLVYDLNGGIPMLNFARKLAVEMHLKICCITRHADIGYIYRGIDEVIFDAGPREFVGYFAKASYVITDSFHGTAFAINYRKPFNTYIALPKASQRIISLLEKCGLLSRIVNTNNLINSIDDCYENFNEQSFDDYRKSSIAYITSLIHSI